jgi:signal transduction histidine kinase
MKLKDFISVKFLAIGLAYTTLFHSVWLFSTQFEIISGTVSWYLPAGVRLAAFLMLPLQSWPMLVLAEKLTHLALFHPGGILDNTAFLSGSFGWYLVHLVISPALLCISVYLFRRKIRAPYIDSVNSTLATLAFGVLVSALLGATFLGRRALELQTDISVFLPILFDFLMGDFVGIIVLCPILFALLSKKTKYSEKNMLFAIIGAWLLFLLLSVYVYNSGTNISYQVKYLAVFPALFLSFRYAVLGSALSCLLIGLTAFVVASQSNLPPLEHQFYIIALCVSCLILGASISQSLEMNRVLSHKNEALERAVNSAQALSSKLVSLQEDERKRLSRDLHDDFGHRIVDLKLQLTLNKALADKETLLNKIDALYQAMKKSLGSLRPSGIDTLPIEAVIQGSAIVSTLKKSNIEYTFEVKGSPFAFTAEQKIHIYRIIQEAVSNSVKYANASRLGININYTEANTTFCVSDNGRGIPAHITGASSSHFAFPTDRPDNAASLGLLSMKERAKLVNGSIHIESSSSSGTNICLSIPRQ